MISLSSIVKSSSFYIHSGKDESGVGRGRPQIESDKSREIILEQAIRKSKHIYSEAIKRADAVIESAKDESTFIKTEAEQRGYKEGYSKGLFNGASEARRRSEEGLEELEHLIETVKKEGQEAVKRREKDILKIAFVIAKKIMRQHILANEDALFYMLEDIIHENEEGIRIFLPEYSKTLDVAIDKNTAKRLREVCKNVKVIVTRDDDFIMAETENGMVDMSIPVQLKQLQDALQLD